MQTGRSRYRMQPKSSPTPRLAWRSLIVKNVHVLHQNTGQSPVRMMTPTVCVGIFSGSVLHVIQTLVPTGHNHNMYWLSTNSNTSAPPGRALHHLKGTNILQLCNIQFSSQSRGALSRVLSSCVLSSGRADAYQEQRKRRDEDHLRREAVLHQAKGLAASRDSPQPWFTSPLFGVLAQTALTWKHQSELNSDLLITGSDLI